MRGREADEVVARRRKSRGTDPENQWRDREKRSYGSTDRASHGVSNEDIRSLDIVIGGGVIELDPIIGSACA